MARYGVGGDVDVIDIFIRCTANDQKGKKKIPRST
jgi:hypothetical protein